MNEANQITQVVDLTAVSAVIGSLLLILFGVVGFFLRALHSDLKSLMIDNGRSKGKISNMEQEIKHNKEMQDTHLENIVENIKSMNSQLIKISEKSSKSDDILIAIHAKIFKD